MEEVGKEIWQYGGERRKIATGDKMILRKASSGKYVDVRDKVSQRK